MDKSKPPNLKQEWKIDFEDQRALELPERIANLRKILWRSNSDFHSNSCKFETSVLRKSEELARPIAASTRTAD
jgi:hypothetical protein